MARRALVFALLARQTHQTLAEECPIPELSALLDWTTDLRMAASAAGLDALASCADLPRWRPASERRVLVVGIDGLRAAAAAMLPLPNLRRLEAAGAYSYYASTQWTGATYSGPGWASVFTGVEPSRHGVRGNSDMGHAAANGFPTFVARAAALGRTAAVAATWHPIVDDLIEPGVAVATHRGADDDDTTDAVVRWLEDDAADVVFAHLDDCDAAGHGHGFDGYEREYGGAARAADARLGRMLAAVTARADVEWLVVVTSDHGGVGYSHGGDDPREQRVPLLAAGNSPRLAVGRFSSGYADPDDLDQGSQMDVGPTLLYFLGGADAVPAGLDGQVFGFPAVPRRAPAMPTEPPTAGCDGDPAVCACADDGRDYRGAVAVTASGRVCQRWASQEPHAHDFTDLEENYCRNPDGEPWAWCYTTDEDVRWELCDATDVPPCSAVDACRDDATWYSKKAPDRTCRLYVADDPDARCDHKNKATKVKAREACARTCGACEPTPAPTSKPACADSTSWFAKKPSRDCAYVAKKKKRCAAKDEFKVKGYDACPVACGTCA